MDLPVIVSGEVDEEEPGDTCGTCKFWGKPEETEGSERFRTCLAVIHDTERVSDDEFDDRMSQEDLSRAIAARDVTRAVVLDGSGYFAALKCKSDFGCVLYQRREENSP